MESCSCHTSFFSSEVRYYIDPGSSFFSIVTPGKFSIAGQKFLDLAESLNYESDRWLQNWLNESYGAKEFCEVEPDWLDWLASRTQQSVSVNFLDKYQDASPRNNYPQQRESWNKASELESAVKSEAELLGQVMVAHAEDIARWSNTIADFVPSTGSVTFAWLKHNLPLTSAQIYLGIILSDRFALETSGEADFYGGFSISFHSSLLC
ncbi:MAG: hypothetical protein AAFQ80_21425 [Cyanobacteria bacterium J06621_8]